MRDSGHLERVNKRPSAYVEACHLFFRKRLLYAQPTTYLDMQRVLTMDDPRMREEEAMPTREKDGTYLRCLSQGRVEGGGGSS